MARKIKEIKLNKKEKAAAFKEAQTIFVMCLIIIFFEVLTIIFIIHLYTRTAEIAFDISTVVEESAYVDTNKTKQADFKLNEKTLLTSYKYIDESVLGVPFKFVLKNSDGQNGIIINIKVSSGTLFVYDSITTRIIDVGQDYNCLNGTTVYYSLCDNFEDNTYTSNTSTINISEVGNEDKNNSTMQIVMEGSSYYATLIK